MTPQDELRILRALRENAEPFHEYVARVAPQFAIVPPHLRPLYDLIQRSRYEQIFATVSMPPRSGKTTSFELAVAWRVGLDPACLNFYLSFGDDRAKDFGRSVRKRVLEAGIPLASAAGAVDDWQTFAGGGLKSTSKNGTIMGKGSKGGLVLIDDIIKSWIESRSTAAREQAHKFITSDAMSRVEGGASVILLNTRWHEDDPIGRIQKDPMGYPWVHINMPAIGDEHGRPCDEREHPERARPLWLNVDETHPGDREAAMRWYERCRARGEHDWWAMYQGVPRSEDTKVFSDSPARFQRQGFNWNGMRVCIAMDPAATAKTSADYTAIVALAMEGYGVHAKMYVLEATKKQITVPAAARLALAWQQKYRFKLVIEKSMGSAVAQIIREIAPGIDVYEIPPHGDKLTRAQPAAAAWNTERIMLPVGVDNQGNAIPGLDWVDDVIRVVSSFTGVGDREDDLTDAIAHGWNALYRERPAQQPQSYHARM